MELRHLRYFIAVAEEKSFSSAAERLYISQPPLSRQIKQLEKEMGVVLIDRNQRPLKLTEAGVFFYEHALQIVKNSDNLRTMTMRKGAFDGSISIGFVGSILYGTLPRVLSRFSKVYPNIQVKLHELNSWQQTQALTSGKIDVGFGRLLFDDASVRRILLREERLVVAVSADHVLKHRDTVSISDLVNENLLLYPKAPRPSFMDHILKLFSDRGIEPSYFLEVSELHVALGLVAADLGITIVPKSLEYLREKEIIYLPFEDDLLTSPVIMNIRHFDKSELLETLLSIIYQIYEEEDVTHKREHI
ncbi:LysR family transcriptional regulator [Psychrobacter alimentarius]|uniref:LysR family transcriptional regulator n=1 Tax=Psychrobacter alimentarius TaxID=261164 RepID=UPI00191B3981|nr:LysR family transcriptional regulator [Psychrobacter alimentarius]